MAVTYYMISEASKLVHVESHVLRYWEEELKLPVERNELGHRVYSEEDIRLFNVIRVLKEKGYQLKAIRELLPHLKNMSIEDVKDFQSIRMDSFCVDEPADEDNDKESDNAKEIVAKQSEENMERFEELLSDIVIRALKRYELSHPMQENVPVELSEKSLGELTERIEELLNRREEREEERLRLLDECIRSCQRINHEQKRKGIVFFLRSLVS